VNQRAAPRLGFRRAQRLQLATEFAQVLRARPIEASAHFQLFRAPNPPGPRLGVIVGKRFVARSVDRNRVKRLVRECFRSRKFDLPPVDHIVRVRSPLKAMDLPALRGELETLLFARRA
jgi:ribonuclease P protein component